MPDPTPRHGADRTPQPPSADAPRPLDVVRARFPRTPDEDGAGLAAHAERLAALRERVDLTALRGQDPALTFDPRNGAS
ncbi:hypothetical protein BH708_15770 [Brachybacterium sp. P6-10-X1]|uniref:hypothetical protein n=1 Tax=Brachybacterium sp. P6-10-X1 TaxID=1903186 RepID=UPI000971844B|nr:hypothetical protein [Brachybacterium sp. P6-10-X1]APX33927.1 hypothetical protein BH708_15770 [Brachybacterium sp. P6-10-X1]